METTIYLPTAEGMGIVRSRGDSWHGTTVLHGQQVQCVTIDANRPARAYCGTFGHGIYITEDGGATWHRSRDLERAKVTALFASQTGDLYAGTEPSEVYRSIDGGESWQALSSLLTLPSSPHWSFPPRPETHHVQAILEDRNRPGRLHVAIEAGALLRTDDGGTVWQDRVPKGPYDTHTLIADPVDSAHLFSAAGDGCFESFDSGATWRPLTDGLKQTYCWSIAVHSAEPTTLLLSASEFALTAHNPQSAQTFVYRRVGKAPWELAIKGLDSFLQLRIPVIAAGTQEPNTFYLATEGMLFRSQDSGSSWKEICVNWAEGDRPKRHSLSMAIAQARY